jgi:hypothetical protein
MDRSPQDQALDEIKKAQGNIREHAESAERDINSRDTNPKAELTEELEQWRAPDNTWRYPASYSLAHGARKT